MRRDVFQAIADPTRREIISMITTRSLNLNAVAENFTISRPAISKHIKILTECGLVVIKQKGRERFCEARLQQLNQVSDWVEQYRQFWNNKLDALEIYLAGLQKKKRLNPAKEKSRAPAKDDTPSRIQLKLKTKQKKHHGNSNRKQVRKRAGDQPGHQRGKKTGV